MDDRTINEIAAGLNRQVESIKLCPLMSQNFYKAALRDVTTELAMVVRNLRPDYPIEKFFRKAGYTGILPVLD